MLVGVEAGCLGIKDQRLKVGVYQVAKNLLEQLGKIDKKNNYLLYSFYPIERELMMKFGARMENIVIQPSRGWSKVWLPLKLSIDKPQVFLGLNQFIPQILPSSPQPYIIGFVYDVAFDLYPEMYPDSKIKLKKQTEDMVKKSNSIVTISNSSKKDLERYYNVNPKKIKVLYPGRSPIFSNKSKVNSPSRCAKEPTPPGRWKNRKYFLFVGALKRIKNVPGLIRGFSYFVNQTGGNYKLYIAGGEMWLDPEIKNTLDNLPKKIKKNIKFLGFVKDEKLINLYQNTIAFVSPSFYEGFGIPFLEAMSLGCPVIGSNTGSVPEIIGDAGILVNPDDYKAVGEAMVKICKNEKLRKEYIKKGLKRAKMFSWENFAEEMISLLELPPRRSHGFRFTSACYHPRCYVK